MVNIKTRPSDKVTPYIFRKYITSWQAFLGLLIEDLHGIETNCSYFCMLTHTIEFLVLLKSILAKENSTRYFFLENPWKVWSFCAVSPAPIETLRSTTYNRTYHINVLYCNEIKRKFWKLEILIEHGVWTRTGLFDFSKFDIKGPQSW